MHGEWRCSQRLDGSWWCARDYDECSGMAWADVTVRPCSGGYAVWIEGPDGTDLMPSTYATHEEAMRAADAEMGATNAP